MVAAVVAGGLIGALLAVFAIRYLVNQVVLGVVLNVFALGLTGFLYDALMQPHQDQFNSPGYLPRDRDPGALRRSPSSGRCCSTPTSSST